MAVQLETTPYWISSASIARYPRLERDERADVVVVGGGITGLTAAYQLARAGASVVLVERRRLAGIDTGHTTAHLTMVTDRSLTDLERSFGRNHAQAVWEAGLAAMFEIDALVRQHEIECGFAWVPAYLHASTAQPEAEQLAELEAEASLAAELGFDAAFAHEVPFVGRPGIRFANQARFHPRQYLARLADAFIVDGGRIYEETDVREFSEKPRGVKANGARIECDWVVIATHNPIAGWAGAARAALLQTKLALFSSYVVAARVEKGSVPDALWWDTASPYRYLRLEPRHDHDLVIYGGEDHKTGQAEDTTACFERLESGLQELVPGASIAHRWSGQVIETPDGLPYIGETAERQLIATGFAGNGLTFGTLAGMMAADRVLQRTSPWADLFDPDRKTLSATWNYVKENKDYPYYMIRDRFVRDSSRAPADVSPGRGGIVVVDGRRIAAYRDETGALTELSATCTHMGCAVEWNEAERTWDCPCHGSRFSTDGSVIAGPAATPLGRQRR